MLANLRLLICSRIKLLKIVATAVVMAVFSLDVAAIAIFGGATAHEIPENFHLFNDLILNLLIIGAIIGMAVKMMLALRVRSIEIGYEYKLEHWPYVVFLLFIVTFKCLSVNDIFFKVGHTDDIVTKSLDLLRATGYTTLVVAFLTTMFTGVIVLSGKCFAKNRSKIHIFPDSKIDL
ncbi:hypothetical protein H4R33_004688 [Dimargaris cristalligena]|uniref:Uncharacterized protein n=1 Tax=Dimargaris cristalligena TaxID=215637 RepID=A0A4Q0A445_9FUNG|nr:hypothetical protein H4R33_004688 [Dimargaris cristalligena]RKP40030.1 hypothetical protein BJ085DRAFT_34100 [Dimargaris cristalligena]|eukprot:RKP40030.1 hypothetical protein BJ085DRAFT_34100 [Dimargaris cristalligena]